MTLPIASGALTGKRLAQLIALAISYGCDSGSPSAPASSAGSPEPTAQPHSSDILKRSQQGPSKFTKEGSVQQAEPNCCMALNACKGQGGCAVPESHACAGKNACEGRGGCRAHCPK